MYVRGDASKREAEFLFLTLIVDVTRSMLLLDGTELLCDAPSSTTLLVCALLVS